MRTGEVAHLPGAAPSIGPTRTCPRPGARTTNSYVPGTRLHLVGAAAVAGSVSATGTARAW